MGKKTIKSLFDRENLGYINLNFEELFRIVETVKEISLEMVNDGKLTDEQFEKIQINLNGLIKKGEVSISDIDKSTGKIDQTYLAEELIQQIAGTANINAIPPNDSITRDKLNDEYLNNGFITNGTDTYLIKKTGNYMSNPNGNYLNLPVEFNKARVFLFEVRTISNAWLLQTLTDFTEPMNSWKRVVHKTNDSVKNNWYKNYNVSNSKINSDALSDTFDFRENLANNTDLNNVYKSGIYTGIGTNTYLNVPVELEGKSFILKSYSGRVDGAFNVQEITPMDDNNTTYKRYRMSRDGNSEWSKYKSVIENDNNSSMTLEGKNIVMFGDSITENGTYPEQIQNLTKSNVIKAGFGGCRMAQHQQSGTGLLYDKQSMYRLVDYIKNNDFTELVQATEDMVRANGDDNRPQANRLKNTDWDKVDYITIFFGTNDYGGDIPIGTDDDQDGSTFKGAVNKVIKTLSESNPKIKFVFITPFYRDRFLSGDNNNSDVYANGTGSYLNEYVKAIEKLANDNHIPVINMMDNSGINKYNQATYLADGLHPNEYGYAYIAEQLAKKLTVIL